MADPFGGTVTTGGRQRTTQAKTKIDAAREALLLHLDSLGQATQVTILAFTTSTEPIFEGASNDTAAIRTALAGVEPHGGTDIAAALRAAKAGLDIHPADLLARILLISDGLSDATEAAEAAAELQRARIPIDAILIDTEEAAIDLIRRVVGASGSVTGVTSEPDMRSALESVSNDFAAERAAAQTALESLHQAVAQAMPAPAEDDVGFTVASPGELAQDTWASLLVFMHLASLTDQVRSEALGTGRLKGADVLSAPVVSTRLSRGTDVVLTPRIPGFDVNPRFVPTTWSEDIGKSEFRIRPTNAPPGPVVGEVEVAVQGLPIARIPVSIQVRAPKEPRPSDNQPALNSASAFRKVFASYARTDLPVVEACAKVYRGLGIYVIVDKHELLAGEAWQSTIKSLIAASDAFQLFWSPASSVSDNVRDEIMDGLAVQSSRGIGFIRPTYWEEPPPALPANLSHLNFAFLDLKGLGASPAHALPPPPGRDIPLEGASPIPVTVLPLMPDSSAAANRDIAADTAFAVRFIEQTLGVRYYPVPTLLVDRFTVRAVRKTETVDLGPYEQARQDKLHDLAQVLQVVCLDLHVCRFWKDADWEIAKATAAATAQHAAVPATAFEQLRYWCESDPGSWLLPPWRDHPAGLADCANVRDAAARVVGSALKDTGENAQLQIGRYRLDDVWPAWRDRLEPLGLMLAGHSYDTTISGSRAAFRQGLGLLWADIEPVLTAYKDRFGERPALPEGFDASLTLADTLCDGLLMKSKFGPSLGLGFVHGEVEPKGGWRAAHGALLAAGLPGLHPAQTFIEFADAYFGAVARVLQSRALEIGAEPITGGYALDLKTWERLVPTGVPRDLDTVAAPNYGLDQTPKVLMVGSVGAFAQAVERAWAEARALLGSAQHRKSSTLVVVDAPTYGIFAPARASEVDAHLFDKARSWAVPSSLVLPGTPRVLLCSDALDDFRAAVDAERAAPNLARLFLRSILVHEHFHAYAATSPTEDGHPPAGPGFEQLWQDAIPVNEALATWMQVHLARNLPDLSAKVWDYINFGDYPSWPYAGAAVIEQVFGRQGLAAVRSLVELLRSDPPAAVAWMQREGDFR
ncbi:TIR domain-containing protein [Labrys okinawensis]|uniref:TIR domain-containing protein n=1 Tax=Labrys okinawensis TaxID=346911 RepID=UPI0039BCE5B2